MPRYKISFNGRTKNAIGIFSACSVVVEADDPAAALLKVYDTHEHVSFPTFKKLDDEAKE